MLQRSIIIIINYYLFMQHFNICEARLELARGFLGKAQAWLKLKNSGSFQHYRLSLLNWKYKLSGILTNKKATTLNKPKKITKNILKTLKTLIESPKNSSNGVKFDFLHLISSNLRRRKLLFTCTCWFSQNTKYTKNTLKH